jgi:hypothetical protein
MRLEEVGPNDREYGMQRTISGKSVEDERFDATGYAIAQLKHAWERAKAQYGFPADAVPEWRISWYYIERKP